MSVKRNLKSSAIAVILLSSMAPSVHAEDYGETQVHASENKEPTFNFDAKVEFVDLPLVGSSRTSPTQYGVDTKGVIREEYSHSYYAFDSGTITKYNSLSRTADKFLISVARGQTVRLGKTVSVTGSVQINSSVSGDLFKVISLGLNCTASGSYTGTFTSDLTFGGPPENSKYRTRDYYGAIGYDRYTVKIKKYDVYKKFNGNAYIEDEQYFNSTQTVSSVEKPKEETYPVDHN
ncbi:hypothetical protein EEL31_05015 [Brevibacillus laterosporus]|nr:hypothetical protein [Brevibacillus laterosporus]TPG67981.1 hypothetical protein EEL31_05015 [Brevibacillus laterosporus]